ncbi:MAG: hypothetical protein NG737_00375 [Omnitrophica bacterium]|nr:hypothetical protein [Candidatus Omnitrophota bacterium]
MDKTKLIPVVLLFIILGIGFVSFAFYTKSQSLETDNENLKREKTVLIEENNSLKYKYDNLEEEKNEIDRRLASIDEKLEQIETERDSYERKWNNARAERDELAEKLKARPSRTMTIAHGQESLFPEISISGDGSDEHWADFVKKKAALEARVEGLNEELLQTRHKIAQLDKGNKELSIKIDQLTKLKERLVRDIRFKERTLRIMSMDLVSEREERGTAINELKKLRSENVSLKRELVLANRDKMKLQTNFKTVTEKKRALQQRIMAAENVLKEKSMLFRELQEQLEETITGGKRITAAETASVELPPIVVRPDAPGLRGLRGEIVAVNRDEKFVVVDIGESSGIRPGVLLKVMRGDRELATLEVIETRREISAADVKEVIGGVTIQEGDVVISR